MALRGIFTSLSSITFFKKSSINTLLKHSHSLKDGKTFKNFKEDLIKKLAKSYINKELNGATLAFVFKDITKKLTQVSKADWENKAIEIRNNLAIQGSFAAAIIDNKLQIAIKSQTKTLWLSDDTLIKNIRHHPEISLEIYKNIPELLKNIDFFSLKLSKSKANNVFEFTLSSFYKGKKYFLVVKVVKDQLFLQSLRRE